MFKTKYTFDYDISTDIIDITCWWDNVFAYTRIKTFTLVFEPCALPYCLYCHFRRVGEYRDIDILSHMDRRRTAPLHTGVI